VVCLESKSTVTIRHAVDTFLLSCKVEGKSCGTIECYVDKLKGFVWYATNRTWLDDITAITTNQLREFLVYLRETSHRFNSTCPRAMKPVNSTTIQLERRMPSRKTVVLSIRIGSGRLLRTSRRGRDQAMAQTRTTGDNE
jgi:hypothetical protein